MEWYWFAMICALLAASGTILEKKVLFKEHSFEFATVGKFFQAALVLLLLPFLSFDYPWWIFLAVYFLSIVAVVYITFETKAYRHLELSAVAPLGNLGPAFLLVLAFLFLGERINSLQGIGIFTLVVGSYFLEAKHHWTDIRSVFNSLKSKYITYFFLGLFLSSFVALGNKYFVNFGMNILSLTFLYYIFAWVNFTVMTLLFYGGVRSIKHGIKSQGFPIFVVGLFFVLHRLFFLKALSLEHVSLVMPIAHTGILLSTLVGGELFHEKHVWQRTFACTIMILGAYLIIVG